MADKHVSRRSILRAGAFIGCSAAAFPMISPVALAAGPWDGRLVVIILRGGMDGLDVVRPVGDPSFAALRPGLSDPSGTLPLDGFFAMNAHLSDLAPLWNSGELAFAHAVSTPYRDKRSHFDGQDFLENGGHHADGRMTSSRDGWLNRAIARIPGAHVDTAIAVGRSHMLLLDGQAPAGSWSPTNEISLADDERRLLSMLYAGDPLFANALKKADMLSQDSEMERVGRESGATLAFHTNLNVPDEHRRFCVMGTHGMAEALRYLHDRVLECMKKTV